MTVTPNSAARAGMSRSGLYRAAAKGELQRISRGLYAPADSPAMDWDLVEAVALRERSTVCLMSALAHHDLVDTIPVALDIAIPRGGRVPPGAAAITWHRFDRETFDIGREPVLIPNTDMRIGLYSPERSIVDAFRLRGVIGYESSRDALRRWLRLGGQPSALIEIASALPRARTPVLAALEALS